MMIRFRSELYGSVTGSSHRKIDKGGPNIQGRLGPLPTTGLMDHKSQLVVIMFVIDPFDQVRPYLDMV